MRACETSIENWSIQGEQEVDLFRKRNGLAREVRHRCVRGADEHAVVPRDGKEDATVAGLGDHQRAFARQESAGQHHVRALARGERGCGGGFVEAADPVGKHTGGIEHDAGVQLKSIPGFSVARSCRRTRGNSWPGM